MFSDPLTLDRFWTTITANASYTKDFPASERAADHSTYRYADADFNDHIVRIAHQYGRTRARYTARYDVSGLVPSSYVPSENTSFSQSCYVVFDCPLTGPITSTSTVTNLALTQMGGIGSLLISTAGSPLFLSKVVQGGET